MGARKDRKNFARRGQSFLALIFLIGGIVSFVGLLIAFLANSVIDTNYGLAAGYSAQAAAESGIQDALLQLNRNTSFASTGYTLQTGSTTVDVSVTQNSPSSNYVTIVSSATVSLHTRKITAVAAKNASTSVISIISSANTQ